jgi:hypothetical protein
MKRQAILISLAGVVLLLLIGCTNPVDGGGGNGGEDTVSVTGITLEQTSLVIVVGDTDELTATVVPENASDKTVSWSSSDSAIATVDADGVVSGIAEGTATITATTNDGGHTAEATATVDGTASAVAPYLYVSTSTGDDFTGTGLSDAPWATISHAISQAVSGQEIRVAEGVYDEYVILKQGVSLYGGYSASDWTARDDSRGQYVTTIRNTGSESETVLARNLDNSVPIVIDGFVIQSGDPAAPESGTVQAIIVDNASPTFSNNTIAVYVTDGGTAHDYGYAVEVTDNNSADGTAPIFTNNSIVGDTGGDADRSRAFTINATAAGPLLFENNTIDAGESIKDNYGIRLSTSNFAGPRTVTIRGNTIISGEAGNATDGYAIAYGLLADEEQDSLLLENNTFQTGTLGDQYLARIKSPTAVTITGNTFAGQTTVGGGATLLWVFSDPQNVTVSGNTFELAGASDGSGGLSDSRGVFANLKSATMNITGNTFRTVTSDRAVYTMLELRNQESDGSTTVSNNILEASVGGGVSKGFFIWDASPVITNNVIVRRNGGADSFRAIEVSPGVASFITAPVIDNNTIVYQNTASSDFIGIRLEGSSAEDIQPIIRNNLIANISGSAVGSGIYQQTSAATQGESAPERFQNNAFYDVGTLWSFSDAGMTDLTAITDVNDETKTTLGTSGDGTADGNVDVDTDEDSMNFNDPSDSNSDANDDFELTASSPTSITDGGLDLLSDAANAVTTDYTGATRTTPFSIGAYEKD